MISGYVVPALLFILPFTLSQKTCQKNPYVNGCVIPGKTNVHFQKTFGPACNLKTICYFCGAHNNLTFDQCNDKFEKKLDKICDHIKCSNKKKKCKDYVKKYVDAAKAFAKGNYKNPSSYWCKDPWVAKCW